MCAIMNDFEKSHAPRQYDVEKPVSSRVPSVVLFLSCRPSMRLFQATGLLIILMRREISHLEVERYIALR